MMLQVAGGILIAVFLICLIGFGLTWALDRDNQAIGETGCGWWMVAIGLLIAASVIYQAFA